MVEWNRVKSNVLFPIIMVILSIFTCSSCHQKTTPGVADKGLENGWYHIVDEDSIIPIPIVTVKEFAALRVDSDYYGMCSIVGQVKEDSIDALFKVNNWEKDTLLLNRVDAASWDSLINALDYGEAKALVRGFED